MASSCAKRPQTTPPWGLSEPHVSDIGRRRSTTSRPTTRTEMLRTRRQELLRSLAGDHIDLSRTSGGEVTPWWGEEVNWWTLSEGYRENAMESMSRCELSKSAIRGVEGDITMVITMVYQRGYSRRAYHSCSAQHHCFLGP